MKRITLLAALLLAACTDAPPAPAAAALAPGVALDAAQSAIADEARAVCPGLDEYAPDLRIVSVDAAASPASLVFEIPEKPAKVPDSLKAWGNRCEIAITAGRATTTKRACASACMRREATGDGPPYALN